MNRAERAAQRRRDWHEERVAKARTPRMALWAACGWLVAEAWRVGRDELEAATEYVLTRVHEIRDGGARNDNGHRA